MLIYHVQFVVTDACDWQNYFSYFSAYREQALLNARDVPVLSKHRDMDFEKIYYPHVYDARAEAMKTSAFIGGAKVCLWCMTFTEQYIFPIK